VVCTHKILSSLFYNIRFQSNRLHHGTEYEEIEWARGFEERVLCMYTITVAIVCYFYIFNGFFLLTNRNCQHRVWHGIQIGWRFFSTSTENPYIIRHLCHVINQRAEMNIGQNCLKLFPLGRTSSYLSNSYKNALNVSPVISRKN